MAGKAVSQFAVVAQLIWPVRAAVASFSLSLRIQKQTYRVSIDYPATIQLTSGISVPSISWTRVTIGWRQPFNGTLRAFRQWGLSSAGKTTLMEKAEVVQAEIVDRLYRLTPDQRDLVVCIRHFGPRDWVAAMLSSSSFRLFELIGSGMLYLMSSRVLDPTLTLRSSDDITAEERTLHRAAHLSECGYPTESLLLAFSVLDAAVQRFLQHAMVGKGVSQEAATELLRNTTTKRLATYLDSVLHLATGQSLRVAHRAVFDEVVRINRLRNDAIHNGLSVSRSEGRKACDTVLQVLRFLGTLKKGIVADGTQLTFMAPI